MKFEFELQAFVPGDDSRVRELQKDQDRHPFAVHAYPDQMLARLVTDHGDGTATLDYPGTSIEMSRVPICTPRLARKMLSGMTTHVKFNSRDRGKPRIVALGPHALAPSSTSRSYRAAWQQMESVPELSCLAWKRCEMWEQALLAPETTLVDLTTYGVAEGGSNYIGRWGGTVIIAHRTTGAAQIIGLAVRIPPDDSDPPAYDGTKSRLDLVCVDLDSREVQWVRPVLTGLNPTEFVWDGLANPIRPLRLHHDPYNSLLIARGPWSDGTGRTSLYVWGEDAVFKKATNLGYPLHCFAIAYDFAVKCWVAGDESGAPADSFTDPLVRGWTRDSSSHAYTSAWRKSPKDWLGLSYDDTSPTSPLPGILPNARPQRSTVQAFPATTYDYTPAPETGHERFPYHQDTDTLFLYMCGHEGLDWWFSPYTGVDPGIAQTLQDRATRFDWIILAGGFGLQSDYPHYRLNETRQLKATIVGVDPRTGEKKCQWTKTISASSSPTVDTDISGTVIPTDPSPDTTNMYVTGAVGTAIGWASHGQFPALYGTGFPKSPAAAYTGDVPYDPGHYNIYQAAAPDYGIFRPHLSGDLLALELHPAGLVCDQLTGSVLHAGYEPYQILTPPVNGMSIAGEEPSPLPSSEWSEGVSGLDLVGFTINGVDGLGRDTYQLDYEYAGILQQQLWKRTFLIRLDASGAELVETWNKELTIYDTGYDWSDGVSSGRSSLGRALRLPVRQIIPLSELGWVLVIRDFANPSASPRKPAYPVLEIRSWDSGDLVQQISLQVDSDGVESEQFPSATTICYNPPSCTNTGTFAEGDWKHYCTYNYPAKAAIGQDGVAWVALGGAVVHRVTDVTDRRLLRVLLGTPPTLIVDDQPVGVTHFDETALGMESLAFIETGASAVWTTDSKLLGSLPSA